MVFEPFAFPEDPSARAANISAPGDLCPRFRATVHCVWDPPPAPPATASSAARGGDNAGGTLQ